MPSAARPAPNGPAFLSTPRLDAGIADGDGEQHRLARSVDLRTGAGRPVQVLRDHPQPAAVPEPADRRCCSGEVEDRYSHTDLCDFAASVAGSKAAYGVFRTVLSTKDGALVRILDGRFAARSRRRWRRTGSAPATGPTAP